MPDGTEQQKDSIPDFAKRIKAKYQGAYDGVDDADLVERFVIKNPVYADRVDLPQDFKLLRTSTGYKNLDDVYEQAGRTHNVDPNLLLEQGRQETINFKPDVMYGRQGSPKNAQGSGQFIPGTAKRFNVDVKNPLSGIDGQARYMRELLDKFDDDENLALAGYNSGENRDSLRAGKIPNIAETKDYVKKISGNLAKARESYGSLRSLLGLQQNPAETMLGKKPIIPPTGPGPTNPNGAVLQSPVPPAETQIAPAPTRPQTVPNVPGAQIPQTPQPAIQPQQPAAGLQTNNGAQQLPQPQTVPGQNAGLQTNKNPQQPTPAIPAFSDEPKIGDAEETVITLEQQAQINANAAKVPIVGTVDVDPKLDPEEKIRQAANKLLTGRLTPTGAITSEDIDKWIQASKDAGVPVFLGDPNDSKVTIRQDMLDQIFNSKKKSPEQLAEELKQRVIAPPSDEAYRQRAIDELTAEHKDVANLNRIDRTIGEEPVKAEAPTEDEIQKRIAEYKSIEPTQEEKSRNYDVAQNESSFSQGIYGGVGGIVHHAAGISRALGITPGYQFLSKLGTNMQAASQFRNQGEGPKGATENVLNFAGESIPQFAELALTPGKSAILKFGALGGLGAAGRGENARGIAKETAVGAGQGGAFEASELFQNPLAKLGTVFGGSAAVSAAAGSPIDQALQNAVVNTLFKAHEVYGSKIAGQFFRFWKGGEPLTVGVTPKGEVIMPKGEVKTPNEIVLDPKNSVYTNEPQTKIPPRPAPVAENENVPKTKVPSSESEQVSETSPKISNAESFRKLTEGKNQELVDRYGYNTSPERQDEILSKIKGAKNISTGGSNNLGVFDIGNGLVVKVLSEGNYPYVAPLKELTRDVGKIKVHDIFNNNGKTYVVQDQAKGQLITDLSSETLKDIPQKHYDDLVRMTNEYAQKGLLPDPSKASNLFYDPEDGFTFIDFNPLTYQSRAANESHRLTLDDYYIGGMQTALARDKIQNAIDRIGTVEAKPIQTGYKQNSSEQVTGTTQEIGGTPTAKPNAAAPDIQTPAENRTVTHPDENINGKPVIAETADGRVVVPNAENKAGVSVVKDQSETKPDERESKTKAQPLSNTQVEFLPEQAKPFEKFRTDVIDPADVADKSVLPEYAKDGIHQIEPHITVKYGLHTNNHEDVIPSLKGEKPIEIELGKTSVFKGSEKKIPGTDKPIPYDVVTVAVKSPDLERLNKKLTEGQENTTTFPYSPHVTLAYVKSGMGEKYANRADFEGQKYTFDGVTFSPADKSGKSVIPLENNTATVRQDPIKANQKVFTERGTEADIETRTIPRSQILTSLDEGYPAELQPRDRSRVASQTQINEIAGKLNPELLGDSPKASDGRPLVVCVDVDGETKYAVVSGNGRVEAIRKASGDSAESYDKFVQLKGGKSGDVYVGLLDPKTDLETFAREANESSTAKMSASEQAQADAKDLDLGNFTPSEDGSIHTGANREFIRAFVGKLPASERGGLMLPDGTLSQEGVNRIRNAVFAKAYGDSETGLQVIQRMAESTDNNVKRITAALLQNAPGFADLKEGVSQGSRFGGLDVTADITKAVEKFSSLREQGLPVAEYLKQQELFGEDLTPFQKRVLTVFDFHKNSAKALSSILNNYVRLANALGDPNQTALFGEPVDQNGSTLFHEAVLEYERGNELQATTQISLLDSDQGRTVQSETGDSRPVSIPQPNEGTGAESETATGEPETVPTETPKSKLADNGLTQAEVATQLNRFTKSGDLHRYHRRIVNLTRSEKIRLAENLRAGDDPTEAIKDAKEYSNSLKDGDTVSRNGQVGKVYERSGELRVKYQRNDKVLSEPLDDSWSKTANPEAGSASADLLTLGLSKTIKEDVVPGAKEAAKLLGDSVDDIRGAVFASGRGEIARLASGDLRKNLAEMARSYDVAQHALKGARNYFAKNPIEDNHDFIAHIEGGNIDALPPEEQPFAKELRRLLDESRDRVQALGTGKLENFIEDYFPHIWKDPKQATDVFRNLMARRPFEGSKSFLKKRSIDTFKDGLDAGLEPISDNPVDLALLKIREMDKYVAAHETLNYLKENGFGKFVPVGETPPAGTAKIDDRIGQVFAPPTMTKPEYVDTRLYEGMQNLAKTIGISHDRLANAGRGRIGYSEQGGDHIVTQYATGERVLAHEIGHQLDHKYGFIDRFLNNADKTLRSKLKTELHSLADSKQATLDNPEGRRTSYTRKKAEQMAHILEGYVNDRKAFEQKYPTVSKVFNQVIDENPELEGIRKLERSLGKTELTTELYRGGITKLGDWYVAEPAAKIINNHLSPGLQGSSAFRAWRYAGNLMNQFQLGFSAFHAAFTTLDAITSKAALSIEQLGAGHPIEAAKSAAEVPVSWLTNLIRGDKVFREWLTPGSTDPVNQEIVRLMVEAGGRAKMDDFYHTRAATKMLDAFKRGNILGGVLRVPTGAVDLVSRPVLEQLVPRQKLGVFADLAKSEVKRLGEDATPEQIREAMQRAWNSVDNRMGQLVYDNLFWNRAVKDISMASVRSVGWNLGSIREMGGGVKDTITLPLRIRRAYREGKAVEPIVTHRMAYVAALPMVTAVVGAMTQYLFTGKGPTELKDYFFPRTGNFDENGRPERIALPTYIRDVYAYTRHPEKTATHKLHPLIGTVAEMLENKDYYGTEIRNADDPFLQQLLDEAKFVGKNITPFAVQGLMKERERKGGIASKILPFFGFTPAPKDVNSTKAEDLLSEIQAQHREVGSRTKAEAERSLLLSDLVRAKKLGEDIRPDLNKGISAEILKKSDVDLVLKRASTDYLSYGVKKLPLDDALKVYEAADEAERQKLFEVMRVKASNAAKNGGLNKELKQRLNSLGIVRQKARAADSITNQ